MFSADSCVCLESLSLKRFHSPCNTQSSWLFSGCTSGIFFLPSEEYGSCPLLSPTESDRETPRGLYTHGLTLPIWKPFFSLTGTVGILCKMREKLEGPSIDSPYNDCPVSQKRLHLPSCQVSFHLGRNSLHSG